MTLPRPEDPAAPKYWMDEVGGELKPAIHRFLTGGALSLRDLALIRAYLEQWADSSAWDLNPHLGDGGRQELADLRKQIHGARALREIRRLVDRLVDLGMDPL